LSECAAAVSDCNVHICDPRTGDSSMVLQGKWQGNVK
jgi:hypothetical protein